ncbi:hypothetical protein [Actinoplanes sp. NPDC051494]|uniref:hypothetical protein n=1 Tax=Actinoplanes sp. NPDC051494 TaxID=3363907 RepID=UPI0037B0CE38
MGGEERLALVLADLGGHDHAVADGSCSEVIAYVVGKTCTSCSSPSAVRVTVAHGRSVRSRCGVIAQMRASTVTNVCASTSRR